MRICFDVDGVVADDTGDLPYSEREPYPDVVERIRRLKKDGHEILFFTARYMRLFDGDQARAIDRGEWELGRWLIAHDIPFDEIYLGKPSYDLMVDDKACRVNSNKGKMDWVGSFEPVLNELMAGKQ